MELIISLAMKFWMWTILIIVVILGAIINLFDKKKPRCDTCKSNKMPVLIPLPIKTKGKGFWKGILLWLLGVRNWELAEDYSYELNDKKFVYQQVLNLMVQVYQNSCIHFSHQLVCY